MLQDTISRFKSGFDCYTELRRQFNGRYTLTLTPDGHWTEDIVKKGGVSAPPVKQTTHPSPASSKPQSAMRQLSAAMRLQEKQPFWTFRIGSFRSTIR